MNTVNFMLCIFPHKFRRIDNSSKTCVSEKAGILTPSGRSLAAAFTSVIVLVPPSLSEPLAAPASVVPSCLERHLEKRVRYLDTRINVPPNSTHWPDIRNEFFSITPLAPVECSMNTTCYTSMFLAKRGPGVSRAQVARGSQRPPFLQCGLASLPARALHGQDLCDQGNMDCISSVSPRAVRPCFVKHVFGK